MNAKIEAMLEEICGPLPKPKGATDVALLRILGPPPLRPSPARLVCVDGRVVADAVVIVSPSDVN
jgi:hypothetical protein